MSKMSIYPNSIRPPRHSFKRRGNIWRFYASGVGISLGLWLETVTAHSLASLGIPTRMHSQCLLCERSDEVLNPLNELGVKTAAAAKR